MSFKVADSITYAQDGVLISACCYGYSTSFNSVCYNFICELWSRCSRAFLVKDDEFYHCLMFCVELRGFDWYQAIYKSKLLLYPRISPFFSISIFSWYIIFSLNYNNIIFFMLFLFRRLTKEQKGRNKPAKIPLYFLLYSISLRQFPQHFSF